jgi:ABC-type transporter Mla subunit MlaD
MADRPPFPDADIDTGDAGRTPRWVYVFGIVALVLIVLVVVLLLTGGGNHGPGRHTP